MIVLFTNIMMISTNDGDTEHDDDDDDDDNGRANGNFCGRVNYDDHEVMEIIKS